MTRVKTKDAKLDYVMIKFNEHQKPIRDEIKKMAVKEHRSIQGQCIFLMELGIKYYKKMMEEK
tara:strand:+ start:388 stop:576 length:189 start_codon:yes stop_codon:yes gene_type:complete